MADIFNMVDTWNNGATTFTAIKMNVTDTASAAASLLMDLQVGGVTRVSIQKNGSVGINRAPVSSYDLSANGSIYAGQNLVLGGNTSGIAFGALGDIVLIRDAADTLAQRRSTNPQAFRLYNTYTDASNYERGFMRYATNKLEIGHEGAGTGNNGRTIAFRTSGFDVLSLSAIAATFGVNVSMAAASITAIRHIQSQDGFHEMVEMTAPVAPSANGVRIYAEDNGSGKTRLMALFATGAAQQIAIEP